MEFTEDNYIMHANIVTEIHFLSIICNMPVLLEKFKFSLTLAEYS